MIFAATSDETFKERTDYLVAQLRECQRVGKSELICALLNGAAPLYAILNPTRFVSVLWCTIHKILAGQRDAYLFTRYRTAPEVLVMLSDRVIAYTQNLKPYLI